MHARLLATGGAIEPLRILDSLSLLTCLNNRHLKGALVLRPLQNLHPSFSLFLPSIAGLSPFVGFYDLLQCDITICSAVYPLFAVFTHTSNQLTLSEFTFILGYFKP